MVRWRLAVVAEKAEQVAKEEDILSSRCEFIIMARVGYFALHGAISRRRETRSEGRSGGGRHDYPIQTPERTPLELRDP